MKRFWFWRWIAECQWSIQNKNNQIFFLVKSVSRLIFRRRWEKNQQISFNSKSTIELEVAVLSNSIVKSNYLMHSKKRRNNNKKKTPLNSIIMHCIWHTSKPFRRTMPQLIFPRRCIYSTYLDLNICTRLRFFFLASLRVHSFWCRTIVQLV